MNEDEATEFATKLIDFMAITQEANEIEDNFIEMIHPEKRKEIIDDARSLINEIDRVFPDIDENVCEYSMSHTMKFLSNLKRMRFILLSIIMKYDERNEANTI